MRVCVRSCAAASSCKPRPASNDASNWRSSSSVHGGPAFEGRSSRLREKRSERSSASAATNSARTTSARWYGLSAGNTSPDAGSTPFASERTMLNASDWFILFTSLPPRGAAFRKTFHPTPGRRREVLELVISPSMMLPILNRLFSGKISMVALSAGVAAYERGDRPTGRRLLAIASSAAPDDVMLHERAAGAASQAGDHRMTLDLLKNLVRAQPGNVDLQMRAALAECNLGDEQGAARRCEDAIAQSSEGEPSALMGLLAKLRMPGPPRIDLLSSIHNWLRPRTYVEIGIAQGDSLVLAAPGTRALGVDPAPQVTRPVPPTTTIFAETSDD